MADLPARARLLLMGTWAAAVVLGLAALLPGLGAPSPWAATALAVGIVVGELLRMDLPQRGGGTAVFGLGDAALAAGLLLLDPTDVVLGAFAGVVVLQAVERMPALKFGMNVAQFTAGAAAAALAVEALVPDGAAIGPLTVGAAGIGMAIFLGINACTVGGMIALTSGQRFGAIITALLPTGALLALGDLALAVIAVLLLGQHPWALPALAVPVALLWFASREGIRAQVERERTTAFVEVEHALGAAATPDEVAQVLARAAGDVLGGIGAVWRDGEWVTEVPEGSGWCPIDAHLAEPLRAPAATLGLPVPQDCLAVGLGGGVLVVRPGELPLKGDAEEWVGRLARSGRVHFVRAEAAADLQQERATLQAVVHGTGDGVLLLAADGTVAVWNPAMARLSGIPTGQAVGRLVTEVLDEGPWQVDGVHDVIRPRADRVWRVSVATVEDAAADDGSQCVVAVHDVTAERRAQQARDDMLAIVSHELRTPLTPILASAQLLRRRHDRLDDAQRASLLGQIEDRAEHLARLVDDLLLVGQLSAGTRVEPVVHVEAIRVDALVTDAVEAMRLARPRHQLRLDVEEGLRARTDPVRLRQVLDNLLDNACKFSPPGSQVEVRLHPQGGSLLLQVVDHGRGIPPGDLERVFDQFVRVEDPLTMTTSGAGLGLFIVRELVQALGGTLDMHSELGVGTTVTVRLPRPTALTEVPPVAAQA